MIFHLVVGLMEYTNTNIYSSKRSRPYFFYQYGKMKYNAVWIIVVC